MEQKLSIRFYNDHEVRAIWNEESNRWYFSVLDVIGAINGQEDHTKNRNYWKYLKAKLKEENSELVSVTTQLKLRASDGKKYNTDTLDAAGWPCWPRTLTMQKPPLFSTGSLTATAP